MPEPSRLLRGEVTSFDPEAGLGEVAVGETTYPFCAVAIDGGSRSIAPRTAVLVLLGYRSGGRREAVLLTPCCA